MKRGLLSLAFCGLIGAGTAAQASDPIDVSAPPVPSIGMHQQGQRPGGDDLVSGRVVGNSAAPVSVDGVPVDTVSHRGGWYGGGYGYGRGYGYPRYGYGRGYGYPGYGYGYGPYRPAYGYSPRPYGYGYSTTYVSPGYGAVYGYGYRPVPTGFSVGISVGRPYYGYGYGPVYGGSGFGWPY